MKSMSEPKNRKPIPKFESEDQEREFWATHDSTEYVDWSRARPVTFSHQGQNFSRGTAGAKVVKLTPG
jgi:hypothetical protein